MKLRTSLLIQLALFAVAIAISLYYYITLPDIVPTHWDAQSKANQFGNKLVPVLTLPGLSLLGLVFTIAIPKLSPKNFDIERFESTFAYVMTLMAAFFMYLGVVILRATASSQMDIGRMMMAGIFLFFALLGNVMGKVRRNFYMGVRTPWTLADERVWDATHRSAAHLWFAGGLIGAGLALAGMPVVGSITILMLIAFVPVVHSYVLYRKLVV